jgi:hypothetical protein
MAAFKSEILEALVIENTLEVVHFYMDAIKRNAEVAVRELLKSIGRKKLNVSRPVPVKSKSADPVSESMRISSLISVPSSMTSTWTQSSATQRSPSVNCSSPLAARTKEFPFDSLTSWTTAHQSFQELCTLVICCNGRLQI